MYIVNLTQSFKAFTILSALSLAIASAQAQTTVNSSQKESIQHPSFTQVQMANYMRDLSMISSKAGAEVVARVEEDINEADLMKKQHNYADVMDCYRRAIRKLNSKRSFRIFHDIVYPVVAQDPSLAPNVVIKDGVKTVNSVQEQIEWKIKQLGNSSIEYTVKQYTLDMGEYASQTGHYRTALNILLPLNNPQYPDIASNLALSIACIHLNNYALARKIFDVKRNLIESMPESIPYIKLTTNADLAGMIYLAASVYYASDKNLHLRYAQDAWIALPQNHYIAYTYAIILQENSLHPALQIRLFKFCKAGLQKDLQAGISEYIYYAQCQLDEQKSKKASTDTPAASSPSSK